MPPTPHRGSGTRHLGVQLHMVRARLHSVGPQMARACGRPSDAGADGAGCRLQQKRL